jgi:hypothetical protein
MISYNIAQHILKLLKYVFIFYIITSYHLKYIVIFRCYYLIHVQLALLTVTYVLFEFLITGCPFVGNRDSKSCDFNLFFEKKFYCNA